MNQNAFVKEFKDVALFARRDFSPLKLILDIIYVEKLLKKLNCVTYYLFLQSLKRSKIAKENYD
jgi:hypothetical protein